MCDKKAFPRPWPSLAPLTRPAMSVIFKMAGTALAGFQWETSQSNLIMVIKFCNIVVYLSSGTAQRLVVGSIVQNGKFSAGTALLVMTLKNVDLPTFGRPTIPWKLSNNYANCEHTDLEIATNSAKSETLGFNYFWCCFGWHCLQGVFSLFACAKQQVEHKLCNIFVHANKQTKKCLRMTH